MERRVLSGMFYNTRSLIETLVMILHVPGNCPAQGSSDLDVLGWGMAVGEHALNSHTRAFI